MLRDEAPGPRVVRQTLAQRAGEGATAEAIADAAVSTWSGVAVHLVPIIGAGGIGSLYARSLYLAGARFPWLAGDSAPQSPALMQQADWPFMDLRINLAQRAPAEASNASTVLLDTFLELLATLIGEPLTARILRSLLDDVGPDSPAQEIKQ